jgi:nitrate reductase gamma subunit
MSTLLWVVLPYVSIVVVVGGHVWRYRYDKFGWTTRSSQLHENRLLRLGSPLFHFGILLVALGHVGGLLVPKSRTEAAGITETAYHAAAVVLGTIVLGLGTTVLGNLTGDRHDYRESVSPWFRSIFHFQPEPDLMATAPLGFQPHAIAAWALFGFWPSSRRVHVFSMPLGYLARPYIVYRSREERTPRRGWERVR